MSKVVRVPATEAMVRDIQKLQTLLGTPTTAETVRRTVAILSVLIEKLDGCKEVVVAGNDPHGKTLHLLLPV